MKKTKLFVSMLLSGIMAVSLLAGCGSQTKETSSTSGDGKVKEFTVFYAAAGTDIPDSNRVKTGNS